MLHPTSHHSQRKIKISFRLDMQSMIIDTKVKLFSLPLSNPEVFNIMNSDLDTTEDAVYKMWI